MIIKDPMKPTESANGNHQIAKRNFPSCSLRSQFIASQKPPLLFPNASILEYSLETIWSEPWATALYTAHGSLKLAMLGVKSLMEYSLEPS